jgi:hypothetical protein
MKPVAKSLTSQPVACCQVEEVPSQFQMEIGWIFQS